MKNLLNFKSFGKLNGARLSLAPFLILLYLLPVQLLSQQSFNYFNKRTDLTKPNPAGNEVTFSYTLPAGVEIAVLSLYSANGKLIYKHRLNTGANKLVYNCAHLNQGVY